jgi:hypothetical protein
MSKFIILLFVIFSFYIIPTTNFLLLSGNKIRSCYYKLFIGDNLLSVCKDQIRYTSDYKIQELTDESFSE